MAVINLMTKRTTLVPTIKFIEISQTFDEYLLQLFEC